MTFDVNSLVSRLQENVLGLIQSLQNERHFYWSKPSFKYHKQRRGSGAAPTERPTTMLNKTLCSKLDKSCESEQSTPALLAVDPHIRFPPTDSHRRKCAKWAQCKHQFVIMWKSVSGCQWLTWTHLFFDPFVGAQRVLREVRQLCQTPLFLLKQG